MIKSAIIGASGYIGSHLFRKYRLFFSDCIGTSFSRINKGLVYFDLRYPDLLKLNLEETEHKAVIITSAITDMLWCEAYPTESYAVNVQGTLNLIEQIGIEKIGEIAFKNNLLFHVDANVGGMILPFINPSNTISNDLSPALSKGEGERMLFDFRVKGVTSISIDLYYGMGPKGAGVNLYRDKSLRKHQYFAYSEYPGGLYGSPSLTGSRAGGPIAASWALIKYLGRNGFETPIPTFPQRGKELQVLGKPLANIFAFTCTNIDMVHEQLLQKGWYLEKLTFVSALRMHLSPIHKNSVELFFNDLDISLNGK